MPGVHFDKLHFLAGNDKTGSSLPVKLKARGQVSSLIFVHQYVGSKLLRQGEGDGQFFVGRFATQASLRHAAEVPAKLERARTSLFQTVHLFEVLIMALLIRSILLEVTWWKNEREGWFCFGGMWDLRRTISATKKGTLPTTHTMLI